MSEKIIQLAVFGSTGSIGKSCLDIARKYKDKFKVVSLVANKSLDLFEEQIREFSPLYAGMSDKHCAEKLKSRVDQKKVKIFSGSEISEMAAFEDYDILLAAIVGFDGLESVLKAVRAGKKIALANKESLVAAGELVLEEAGKYSAQIIPVDSEHSALFQMLQGCRKEDLESLTLTASGGPFFKRELKDFQSITPQEAIKHPRWKMGSKISLDSATMFNKALELIEAKWLFGIKAENIEVVIHPQSIVHSMLNFKDGSSFAHMSNTDMKGAIAYALNYPNLRLGGVLEKLNYTKMGALEFYEMDNIKFPAIELARASFSMGKAAGAVLNSANEHAGAAFLAGKVSFGSIFTYVNDALSQFGSLNYSNYGDLLEIDRQVREYLAKVIT